LHVEASRRSNPAKTSISLAKRFRVSRVDPSMSWGQFGGNSKQCGSRFPAFPGLPR
jgi:hypothetical protein